MSIYGDVIEPRGGTVWLGSLIKLLEPMGLNQRLVRTSIFRLTKDDWLSAEQIGRRSYYSLSTSGMRRFKLAFRRVYGPLHPDWSGQWDLLLAQALEQDQRRTLRDALNWQGFSAIAPGVLAHPNADTQELQNTLRELDMSEAVIHMKAQLSEGQKTQALRELVGSSWNLQALAQSYQTFLDTFAPIAQELETQGLPSAEHCFTLRTLLIHNYRKILLKDPQLPVELLPSDWAGSAARALCREIYIRVFAAAEMHISNYLESASGALPAANSATYQRFGGFDKA